ncbi:MAG: NUDIX domain-containing protein [Lachnospiraceae bacterium]|nr:NUDIX domain-containing protein [Lachnospiraceae bacterium]
MEEWLTIYDENCEKTGRALREDAHRRGLWHQVVHCWMVCRTGDEEWLYFQQRAFSKEDFPGYYDIGSTGHVAEGENHLKAVCREAYEEMGVSIDRDKLLYLGVMKEVTEKGEFFDRELCHVYLYTMDLPFFAPGEEVERIVAIRPSELLKAEKSQDPGWKIQGTDLYGEPFFALKEEFCRHPEEFVRLVLPRLKESGA